MRHSARIEAKLAEKAGNDASKQIHTPSLMSPPGTKTPPTDPAKRTESDRQQEQPEDVAGKDALDHQSESVDATALSKALGQLDKGRQREHTPEKSPQRKRVRTGGLQGDRFIPNRSGQDLFASYNLHLEDGSPATPSKLRRQAATSEIHIQKTQEANGTYSSVLRSEMFDREVPQSIPQGPEYGVSRSRTPPLNGYPMPRIAPSTPHKNLFNYSSPAHLTPSLTPRSHSRSERGPNMDARSEIYSLSPVKYSSQKMLLSPRKTPRAVSKVPYKVLDAPELADDFYLNLVDWGSTNVLAVGLGDSVFLWNSESGKVDQLLKLDGDSVTSVGWIQRGSHLAVGTARGLVQVWDTVAKRKLRTMTGHTARISSLAWNAHVLSTGSRDRSILHRDVRVPSQYFRKLSGHKQEVCGLRWNSDTGQLASGGNDNKVFVWDGLDQSWLYRWGEQEGGHKAAVKAVAWSPHQRGLLATGGGTADRCIKFWNTISTSQSTATSATSNTFSSNNALSLDFGAPTSWTAVPSVAGSSGESPEIQQQANNPHLIRSHDTGSQVCNLLFSTLTSEIVSTHGYSQNAINIWKYPSMSQVVSLTGHTFRVLYLSMSPTGDTIVTGAGDETLRFWDAFGSKAKEKRQNSGGGLGSIGNEWSVIR